MKTKINFLFVILTLALFSCSKQDEQLADVSAQQLKSATIATGDIAIEAAAMEANYETDFYAGYERMLRELANYKGGKGDLLKGQKGMHYVEGKAPVVSIETAEAGYPIVITIAYGDNTETKQGRIIKGTVKVEISGPKDADGSTRTVTYTNCMIDDIGIQGTSVETFNGDNITTRKMTITRDVNFTLPDATVVNRKGTTVREWIKGLDTPMVREDDMMQISGSTESVSSTGITYLRSITESLIELGDCHHPVQGVVEYSQNGTVIAMVNYGDGTCDELASLTTDGQTTQIELKGKMPQANMDGFHNQKGEKGGKRKGEKGGKGKGKGKGKKG